MCSAWTHLLIMFLLLFVCILIRYLRGDLELLWSVYSARLKERPPFGTAAAVFCHPHAFISFRGEKGVSIDLHEENTFKKTKRSIWIYECNFITE